MKRALITGITGQTGSYLADLLLEKGYEVHGIVRRCASFNTDRIDHIFDKLQLHFGDLSDSSSIRKIVYKVEPDEVYHMGAQSHVRVSFDIPEYTADVTGVGTLRILEAIKDYIETNPTKRKPKFYFAGSSEMFGNQKAPQNEQTKFEAQSPYAAAKIFGWHVTRNYREAYGIFACCGILFNHECLTYQMPVIIRKNGYIDVAPIGELVPFNEKGPNKQTTETENLEVWDNNTFTKVNCITASKYIGKVRQIVSRMGVLETTPEHVWFDDNGDEVQCGDLTEGSRLFKSESLPPEVNYTTATKEMSWLLGFLCSDGSVTNGSIKIINKNPALLDAAEEAWMKVSCGKCLRGMQKSGFTNRKDIGILCLSGNPELTKWIESNIYTKSIHGQERLKKVPKLILNSSKSIVSSFLDGYCAGDGTKSLPKTTYEFQYYTTKSPILALGLRYCISMTKGVEVTYNLYGKENHIYKGFIRSERSDGLPGQIGMSGHNLTKDQEEITKIFNKDYDGWVFDLSTETHKFTAGTGLNRVHNSERRGETFVTRKITRAATRIKLGLQNELRLGNLSAIRDWGYAKDYAEAIWLMLQHGKPDDYVVATGECYSVQRWLEIVFEQLNLNWEEYVKIDPKYFRPSEVIHLQGDCSKAKSILEWTPATDIYQLAKIMIEHDLELARKERILKDAGM